MSAEIDCLVDRLVDAVNSGAREPVDPEDTPSSVFVGEPNKYGNYDWLIKPYPQTDWINPL